jgi:SIR2-like domain
MDQKQLTSLFCARPQNFAWFFGAGASRSAGLPTAKDIIWDLKRRYYCQEENQDISRQDTHSDAVKARIQAFMDSRGFPPQGAADEYATYFEKIFGADLERQRRYLKSILSEEKVTLTVGNRVLGALIAAGLCRVAFTTNFDSVVEKAVAEVAGRSLSAFHLEGSHAANQALNNEEFPVYCKLHGDFRYKRLKNLPEDLKAQNAELAKCLLNAGTRFGFIVTGYSGRDASIMELFRSVLAGPNPFPHGLYWTETQTKTQTQTSPLPPAVQDLLEEAQAKGVDAHHVPIETFDTLMLRLWRNIEDKPAALDARVCKSHFTPARIPLPAMGEGNPILRLNALPILSAPTQCHSLSFRKPKEWEDLREARRKSENGLILTKSDTVWCWGGTQLIKDVFDEDPASIEVRAVPADLGSPDNLHVKRFVEDALCAALIRGKPLLTRTTRTSAFILVDPHADDTGSLEGLCKIVGKASGTIAGLFTPATEDHPQPEKVAWAEAVRVSIDMKNGQTWLLLDPDIWIWPVRAKEFAAEFMDERRQDRYNNKYNALLDIWIRLILGPAERNSEVTVLAFEDGSDVENPKFRVLNRTGFAWRLKA